MENQLYSEKHQNEINCFTQSLEILKNSKYVIETFPYLFSTTFKNREDEENAVPDLIFINEDTSISVGIEHFRTVKTSKFKENDVEKRTDTDRGIRRNIKSVYETGHRELVESGEPSELSCNNLVKNTVDFTIDQNNHSLDDLVDQFKYNLTNHYDEIINYKKEICKYGANTKFGFLVDTNIFDNNLFIVNKNSITKVTPTLNILLQDFIDIWNNKFNQDVDFIIFALRDTISEEIVNAFIVDPNNLNLEDLIILKNCTFKYNLRLKEINNAEDKIDTLFECDSPGPLTFARFVDKGISMNKKNISFICDYSIAKLFYIFGDKLRVEKKGSLMKIKIKRYKNMFYDYVRYNSNEFDDKFHINLKGK